MPPIVSCPRPRNAAATRAAILEAARSRFLRDSYDAVGVREIAGDAGVDAALVSRYFGSKEDLFAEVLRTGHDGRDLFAGGREDFGVRMARALVHERKDGSKLDGLIVMMRSANSARARELVQRSIEERFHGPFAEWLGEPEGRVRARLVAGVVMGMAISRAITNDFGLEPAETERLCARLAAMLQACVDG